MYDVKVVEVPARRLLGLPHRGPYPEIGPVFGAMFGHVGKAGLTPRVEAMIGVYMDDPSAVAPADLRAFAGVALPEDAECPPGLEEMRLPGGDHAVLTLRGAYSGLADAWTHLYAAWLPASGRRATDAPSFEIYLDDPTDTAEADLLTELCVPLA